MAQPSTTLPRLQAIRGFAARRQQPRLERVSFPELVWAHFLRQQEIRTKKVLRGPAEEEYRRRLADFEAEHGPILNAYWCTREASAAAITTKTPPRVAKIFRPAERVRFHSATDWAARDVPEIGNLLHACDTLAIKVSEVLRGTSARIAMQWVLATAGHLLGVVDQEGARPGPDERRRIVARKTAELAKIEGYYDRAGEKAARLVYFWGMMFGIGVLAVLAVVVGGVLEWVGAFDRSSQEAQNFFISYSMGAIGALVSVMSRMASGKQGSFTLDYEVGRRSLVRLGSFRPFIGAIFALVLYFALLSGLLQIEVPGATDLSDNDSIYFFAVLASFAGFSERWAKVLLGGAERVLPGVDDDDGRERRQDRERRDEPAPARSYEREGGHHVQ